MAKRSQPGDPRVAVAYVRVSTEEQHLGPEAQRAAIEAWATREGVSVVSWHVDHGVSGGKEVDARPALGAALAALTEHGAGLLVVAKRDRIARDTYISLGLERIVRRAGARVVSTAGEGSGDSPADEFMRTVIDGAAAYERGLIRARTKAALGVKKARGERVGGVPYGFRVGADGCTLEENPPEQLVLAQVRELRALGVSHRRIASELAARGMLSRTGRPFVKTQITRMLGGSR